MFWTNSASGLWVRRTCSAKYWIVWAQAEARKWTGGCWPPSVLRARERILSDPKIATCRSRKSGVPTLQKLIVMNHALARIKTSIGPATISAFEDAASVCLPGMTANIVHELLVNDVANFNCSRRMISTFGGVQITSRHIFFCICSFTSHESGSKKL